MNISSCEQLIRVVRIAENLTPDIILYILPEICSLIDGVNKTLTSEEMRFHTLCCNPIPSAMLNQTYNSNQTHGTNEMITNICKLMTSNRQPEDEQFYNEYCPKPPFTLNPHYQLLTYILILLLTPLGIFANFLILLTVYKIKRLRNTTGFFICNLAIADLFVIIEMLLFLLAYKTAVMEGTIPRAETYTFPSFDIFLGSASLLHVTAVSIERGIAVSMPLRYPRYLSEKRAKILIICIWIYCLGIFLLSILRIWIENPFYENTIFYFAVICSFLIPCTLVLTSYGFILVSALKNMKMEQKISKVIVVISMIDNERLEQVASVRPARCREIKIAMNVAIMTIPFVCGWGFFMICNTYEVIADYQFQNFLNWLIQFVPFFVSCINPLTYLMFTRSLRKSSLKLLLNTFLLQKLTKRFLKRRESLATSISVVSDRQSQIPVIIDEHNRLLSEERDV